MAHFDKFDGDYPDFPRIVPAMGFPLITRTFKADVSCPVHGNAGSLLIIGAGGIAEATEVAEIAGTRLGLRPSGLIEVTGGGWL
jgi:hypothetical protein